MRRPLGRWAVRRVAFSCGLVLVAGLVELGGSRPLMAQDGSSCPIPINRQIEAIHAFSRMMPVFRHPRCLNCHGGVDPMSEAHRGADQVDPISDFTEFNAQCQACHDGLPGWRTPPRELSFVGKSDEELCLQVKRFDATGESFIGHIFNDHEGVQFIAAGFAGDRALGEGLGDYGLAVEKPPGTQAELTAKARKWVEILGHGYESSRECGCVVKLEGKFKYTDSGELGPFSNVTRVTGDLVWKPAEEQSSSPTFTDAESTFFRPTDGEITVEVEFDNRGWEGRSSCKGTGRKTFSIDSLTPGALRHMLLEIADDGRYKLTLVIPDRPDPFPKWEFNSVCAWPNVSANDRVPVHSVSVVLGKQQGVIDDQGRIVGQLATPIRHGPRTITGDWSFKTPDR